MNQAMISLSLKYINKNYELMSNISKWVHSELIKYNYNELKLTRSLDRKDLEIIKILIVFNDNTTRSTFTLKGENSIEITFDLDLLTKYLFTYCTHNNELEIIKLLIDNGASVCKRNYPLRVASLNNYIDIVKLLIDNGAITEDDGPLQIAIANNFINITKLLMNNGLKIKDNSLNSELVLLCAMNGYEDMFNLLVENSADEEFLKKLSK